MINTKQYKLYTGILIILLTFSCSRNHNSKSNKSNELIFKPLYVEHLLSMPSDFGTIWNAKHITENKISKIAIISKGGSGPNNTIEKYAFNFNSFGLCDTFSYNNFIHSNDKLDEFYFNYTNKSLSRIQLIKHFGYSNLPPIYAFTFPNKFVICRQRTNQTNDSIIFTPNFQKPKVIAEKIGGKYNSIELVIQKGTSAKRILDEVTGIDSNTTTLLYTEKLITYTKNGLPIESFHLDQNWNQLELAKQWEYNEDNQLVHFSQWVHGKIVKEIELNYNEQNLPLKMIFNRKKFYFKYKKG